MVRRIMSKKKMDKMEIERQKFIYGEKDEKGNYIIEGCINRGVDEKTAAAIFDEMFDFAKYAFNKSHAAAYAYVCYQTAYLKTFYPVEFMASLISGADDTDKINEYIANSGSMGISICPPDVNKSSDSFTVEGNSIRFGLSAIKNVGKGFIQKLTAERDANGDFLSFSDFVLRMTGNDINKRAVEGMIMCGAFDSLKVKRSQLMRVFESVIDNEANMKKDTISGQLSLFDDDAPSETVLPDVEEFDKKTLLKMEKQTIGMYLSGNPMEEYEDKIKSITPYRICDILNSVEKDSNGSFIPVGGGLTDGQSIRLCAVISNRKNKTTRNNSQMAFIKLEDGTGTVEAIVFPKVLTQLSSVLQEESIIMADGKISIRDDEEPKFLLEKSVLLDSVNPPQRGESVYIRLPQRDNGCLAKFKEIAEAHHGNTPVCLYFEREKQKLIAPKEMYINPAGDTMSILKSTFGDDNVIKK